MSSSILDLSTRNLGSDDIASSHDVLPLKPSPTTPTTRRIQAFENQTTKHHASSRCSSQYDFPARESRGTNYARGIDNTGNGLASPSITPPSAYNNNPHPRTRPNPSSPSPYHRSVHHPREAYTVPNSFGAPPISPCASITHPSTASTVDYLLHSAASPSPCSRHSSSPPPPSSAADSSPSPSPPPPGRLHVPSRLEPSISTSTSTPLTPDERTALTGLFTLRTSTSTSTSTPATNRSHPRPRPRPWSPANALSSLPAPHAHKLSCALSLLALRAHCLRDEERRYRRLLVARNLCGDEDLYSDAETVGDEEEGEGEGKRGGYAGREKSVRVVDSVETRVGGREGRGMVVKGGGMGAGKAKMGREGEGDAQRELDEARKRLNVRGRKAIRAPRTGKMGGVVGMGLQVGRRRWTVQALGYRRERRRKRAGTGGRG